MKILDIGCGDKKHPGSIGIDLHYKEADILLDLDENDIPFPDEHFDMVWSDDSIEHFGNPQHIFKEVYRVLKHNGIFHIETVNMNCWFVLLGAWIIDYNKAYKHKIGTKRTHHKTHWTPDMLRMWFIQNGFTPKNIRSHYLFRWHIIMEGIKNGTA